MRRGPCATAAIDCERNLLWRLLDAAAAIIATTSVGMMGRHLAATRVKAFRISKQRASTLETATAPWKKPRLSIFALVMVSMFVAVLILFIALAIRDLG